MNSDFKEDELLLRAVYPISQRPKFWRKDGTLSSAALKDPKGLSVDRTYNRSLEEAINYIKQNLKGNIVSIPYIECLKVKAEVLYLPSTHNPFHSEIHGSQNQIELSDIQALLLAQTATIQKI